MFKENINIEQFKDITILESSVQNDAQINNVDSLFSDIMKLYKVVKARKAFNKLTISQTINRAV